MIHRQTDFHGYRGTNKYWGKQCERSNKLWCSKGEDEYFGHGIYFFENDSNEAYNWALRCKHFKSGNISVIYAFIQITSSDEIFDLIDSKTYSNYIKLVKLIERRYKDADKKPIIKKPYDCKLINDICERENFTLVRGVFNPNHKLGNQMILEGYTRMPKTHIQLCVKDISLIKKIEVNFY